MRESYDSITGRGDSFAIRKVKTSFNITRKRFEATIKGRLKGSSGDTSLNTRFELDILAKGKAILTKKDKRTAKEFNAKRVEGIIQFNEPILRSDVFSGRFPVPFNLRTIVPIKLNKDVFRGNLMRAFAKIDAERSRAVAPGDGNVLDGFLEDLSRGSVRGNPFGRSPRRLIDPPIRIIIDELMMA
ncbi:MAG: hypothetical protein AAFX65_09100 [Cyanobacteria bacterium J06638_7]